MALTIMQRPTKNGDRDPFFTPEEAVKIRLLPGGVTEAHVRTGGARQILERNGFEVVAAKSAAARKAAPAKKQTAPPKPPAASEPAEAPAPEPSLGIEYEILRGSVTDLEKGLRTGEYDHQLDELLECENNGKGRKTAVDAIQTRIDQAGV